MPQGGGDRLSTGVAVVTGDVLVGARGTRVLHSLKHWRQVGRTGSWGALMVACYAGFRGCVREARQYGEQGKQQWEQASVAHIAVGWSGSFHPGTLWLMRGFFLGVWISVPLETIHHACVVSHFA